MSFYGNLVIENFSDGPKPLGTPEQCKNFLNKKLTNILNNYGKSAKKVVKGTDIEKYCSDYIYEARNEDFTEWTPQDAMVIISYDIKKYMKDKNINKTEASKQLFKIHNKIWKEIKSIVGQIDGVIAVTPSASPNYIVPEGKIKFTRKVVSEN